MTQHIRKIFRKRIDDSGSDGSTLALKTISWRSLNLPNQRVLDTKPETFSFASALAIKIGPFVGMFYELRMSQNHLNNAVSTSPKGDSQIHFLMHYLKGNKMEKVHIVHVKELIQTKMYLNTK